MYVCILTFVKCGQCTGSDGKGRREEGRERDDSVQGRAGQGKVKKREREKKEEKGVEGLRGGQLILTMKQQAPMCIKTTTKICKQKKKQNKMKENKENKKT